MFRHMACHIDQVIDDRPVPAALHCPFQMGVLFPKRFLPDHAQYVVGQYGKFQHQFIGLELAGWKPFKVHVCLQLTVELFALPVGVVMSDDFPVSEIRIGPPYIGLNVRDKKKSAPFCLIVRSMISYPMRIVACFVVPSCAWYVISFQSLPI